MMTEVAENSTVLEEKLSYIQLHRKMVDLLVFNSHVMFILYFWVTSGTTW